MGFRSQICRRALRNRLNPHRGLKPHKLLNLTLHGKLRNRLNPHRGLKLRFMFNPPYSAIKFGIA